MTKIETKIKSDDDPSRGGQAGMTIGTRIAFVRLSS
jgi:hypothetical protein